MWLWINLASGVAAWAYRMAHEAAQLTRNSCWVAAVLLKISWFSNYCIILFLCRQASRIHFTCIFGVEILKQGNMLMEFVQWLLLEIHVYFFFISFSVATSGDILTIEMGIIIVKLLVRRLIRLIKLRQTWKCFFVPLCFSYLHLMILHHKVIFNILLHFLFSMSLYFNIRINITFQNNILWIHFSYY